MTGPDKRVRAQALEDLRQRKTERGDLEAIYEAEYAIVMDPEAENKDKNNAAKICAMYLGVGRPGPEKPAEAPKDASPATQTAPLRQELLDAIDQKLKK